MASFTIQDLQEGFVGGLCIQTFKLFGDSADTIDLTTALQGRTLVDISAWDVTSQILSTATYVSATDVATLDAAGGTTDHVYTLTVHSVKY